MKASPFRPTIAKLHLEGVSTVEIAKQLQVSKSTIRKVIAQLKARGNVEELPKCGRPRSVNTNAICNQIKQIIEETNEVSMNKIASCIGISRSTVQRIVKNDSNFKNYLTERLKSKKKHIKS